MALERLIGLTGGVFNFIGHLSSVSVPILIGYLVRGSDFSLSIIYIASTAILGAFCFAFVVGKVERLREQSVAVCAKISARSAEKARARGSAGECSTAFLPP